MDYYSQIAPSYNELHKEEQTKKIEIILKNLSKNEIENSTFLDVGCGTAFYSSIFKNYTGLEPSEGMISQSKAKIIKAYAEKIPLPNKSFDITISISAIHNFKDYKKSLNEIERVTKNKIIITLLKRSKKFLEIKNYLNSKGFKEIEQEVDLILIKELK